MPKLEAKKVFISGCATWPPSASALKIRFASASSAALNESEKPSNFAWPLHMPSEAMICVSPMRKQECMTLSPGTSMPGRCGSGLSLKRISISTFAQVLAIELQGFLAAAVEKEVRLYLHGRLL